ncbi:hypothetical protein OWR28_22315 [Chryseobacterium sp. 1B4]
MKTVNNYVINQLRKGEAPAKTSQGLPITVSLFQGKNIPVEPQVIHTCLEDQGVSRNECKIQINSFADINSRIYKISSYAYITATKEIMGGMLIALFWKLLLITAVVFITARVLSKFILKPFHHAIDRLQKFSIQKKERLDLLPTSTKEFKN